jgi:PTH2 family peptidyl-tRNA hydrolase
MNHYKYKQVIITRKDLNYGTKGKICAMVAHASVAALKKALHLTFLPLIGAPEDFPGIKVSGICNDETYQWITGDFAKIVLQAKTGDELKELYKQALASNLPCSIITDNGTTVFDGVKTLTAVAIGPARSEQIDEITKDLKLL